MSTWIRNKVPVKIKRLHSDAVIPRYATEGAAGFDLVAVEDVIVEPGETALVKTGIAVQLPEGYELQIRPRSGISKKTKLRISNSPGTVDADYTGEVGVLIDNIHIPDVDGADYILYTINGQCLEDVGAKYPHTMRTYIIRKGDRVAQGIIAEAPQAIFEEVDELGETERGDGGFGSTGVKENAE